MSASDPRTATAAPLIDHSGVAEAINASVNYTMYAVFREDRSSARLGVPPAGASIVRALLAELEAIPGLVTRGWYDVSGYRADADLLVWWHAPAPEALQAAYRLLLDYSCGALSPVWSAIGVHRAAEFNRAHVPAFLAGEEPKGYVCVYPFVRGREWYLLPEQDRGRMLREHVAVVARRGATSSRRPRSSPAPGATPGSCWPERSTERSPENRVRSGRDQGTEQA